jgi:hypothetical protein
VKSFVVASILLATTPVALAGEPDWTEIEDDDGIRVWKREVPGSSFVEFRGAGEVKANLRNILAVLHDQERKTEWLNRCVENRLVRARGIGDNTIYNRTGSGFPLVDDRDIVVRSSLEILREKRQVRIDVKNVEDPLAPPVDGVVRMPKLVLAWTLEYRGKDATHVTYQVQADPGGMLPAWVVNLVSKEIPFNTITNLREQVKKSGYEKNLMIVEAAYDWSGIE